MLVFDRTDSTNTRAFSLADGNGHHGTALVAREQTAGRGQYGRTWQAPSDSSVLLSVLLFPPQELRRPVLLTAWAAVSVCQLVERLSGCESTIKWPNDVLIDGKKVCGILIEQQQRESLGITVAGMGLNVNQTEPDFRAAELPYATSLAVSSGRTFDWCDTAKLLLLSLDKHYVKLTDGRLSELELSWSTSLGLVGQVADTETINTHIRGRVREITLENVIIEDERGPLLSFTPEEIRHITPLN